MELDDQSLPEFIPGMELCERFFRRAVQPILAKRFPELAYSAARLGWGSDVLGFDTPMSRDHGWGPRVTLFLSVDDLSAYSHAIADAMASELPYDIDGYPTNWVDLDQTGSHIQPIAEGPINHAVEATSVRLFVERHLGVDASSDIDELAWLAIPAQRLFTIACGVVFQDELDQLHRLKTSLAWYPRDVWLYMMASQWMRIEQEEVFVGRCGDVGDELGSQLIGARQVCELMRLCFLIEKVYIPYQKWVGSAFARLGCASVLHPILNKVLGAPDWKARESWLSEAYTHVAKIHNELRVTPELDTEVSRFYSRPYLVLHADRFVDALLEEIRSDRVRALPRYVGSIDQFADSTDIKEWPTRMAALTAVYRA